MQKQKFIARIEGHGVTYVGLSGLHDKWVKSASQKPVTIVRNERGGQTVSRQDIEDARARHTLASGNYICFANDKTKDIFYAETI